MDVASKRESILIHSVAVARASVRCYLNRMQVAPRGEFRSACVEYGARRAERRTIYVFFLRVCVCVYIRAHVRTCDSNENRYVPVISYTRHARGRGASFVVAWWCVMRSARHRRQPVTVDRSCNEVR